METHILGGPAAQAMITMYTTLAGAVLVTLQIRKELRQVNWRRFLRPRFKRIN